MAEELLTFYKSNDPGIADDLAQKLKDGGIYYQLENDDKFFDPSFALNPLQKETRIKLKSADFKKADSILAAYYDSAAQNIDRDYYLFSFSNTELHEILAKPDEWGKLDYQLAKRILTERGDSFAEAELEHLKTKRIEQLSRPDKSPVAMIVFGYLFAFVGIFAGLIIGFILTGSKKTLPDGKSAYTYHEVDRKHGRNILTLSIAVLAIALVYTLTYRTK